MLSKIRKDGGAEMHAESNCHEEEETHDGKMNDDIDKGVNERFSPGIFKKAPSSKGVINVITKSKLNSGFIFENEISISDKNANTLASDNFFKKRGKY